MGKVDIIESGPDITITINGDTADISMGENGQDGDLIVRNSSGTERIRLDGETGSVTARSAAMVMVFNVNGDTGEVILQGVNAPGHGLPRIRFQPSGANVWIGGHEQEADLLLFPSSGDNQTVDQATVRITGNGRITLKSGDGSRRIYLDGPGGNAWLGGKGQAGDLMLFHEDENDNSDYTKATLWLSGHNGDIILKNADCAEEFDIAESTEIEPGTVMVLDHDGQLQQSQKPYDRKVAGVISGAGDCKPGIILDKKHSANNRMPVALAGKAYCKVDASYSSIEAGDLLTTSPTPGHAMKAEDPSKAFGAVIGKALRPFKEGQGLIPILIAMQ